MSKQKLCVVVPAHNEEKVIAKSLLRFCRVLNKKNIYVVSDGSKDDTVSVANNFEVNVLNLENNIGKAKAVEKLLMHFDLVSKYEYILFSDADSVVSVDFIQKIQPFLEKKPACIIGTVKSMRHGLISAFRTYEYGLSHLLYKYAQNISETITVAPGCGSIYRSDIVPLLNFGHKTLTEDFDLTIQIHRHKLGKIVFAPQAIIWTQDPKNFRDYWKQISRWYGGFWQNVLLHKLFIPKSKLNFEIIISIVDAILAICLIGLFLINARYLLIFTILSCLMIFLVSAIVLAFRKNYWAFRYLPLFPVFYVINISGFIYNFFAILFKKKPSWHKVARY